MAIYNSSSISELFRFCNQEKAKKMTGKVLYLGWTLHFSTESVDLATVSKIDSRGFISTKDLSLFQQRELI